MTSNSDISEIVTLLEYHKLSFMGIFKFSNPRGHVTVEH